LFEIDFIPVGEAGRHGDAIALRFTKQDGSVARVVIDAGFEPSGRALVEHFDRWYGTRAVDLAILTHPDGDHIGGMGHVIRDLEVETLCLHRIGERGGSTLRAAKEVSDLIELAESQGTTVAEPFAPSYAFGGMLRFLSPTEDWYHDLVQAQVAETGGVGGTRLSHVVRAARRAGRRFLDSLPGERRFDDDGGTNPRNNSSIVSLLEVDGTRFLFTADAGVPALERAWDQLQAFGANTSPPEFVDIPHHGSRKNASSDVLDRLLGPVGQAQTKSAYVNVAPEAERHPSPRIANAFMRRGYRVSETRGRPIRYSSSDAPDRGWSPLVALQPMLEEEDD
jgi:beta-lactamase superfamily II metal-dependent hydrolase